MSNFEKKVVPYLTYLGTRPILPDELEQYELHHLLWNNAFFKKDKTIKHLLIRWKIEYFIEEFAYMIFKHVCSHSYNGYNPPRLRHVMQIQINLILLVNME